MSDQQAKKLVEEAAEIRRRYAAETNSEDRAQLTARYYQIEAELKELKMGTKKVVQQAQPAEVWQKVGGSNRIEFSDPFGVRMGTPVVQLGDDLHDLGNGAFGLRSVPKPHSFFENYMAYTSSTMEVTSVLARRKIPSVNEYGSELRLQFKDILSRLERIYGESSRVVDELDKESEWSGPEHWMLALMEGDRRLSAEWDSRTKIPYDLRRIRLYAYAENMTSGSITLQYESIDYELNIKKILAEDDDVL